jgi:hypothetical protein
MTRKKGSKTKEHGMTEYKERRRHPRYTCDTGVRIHVEKASGDAWGTISDISIGGCYIFTFSPLPQDQPVTLAIKADGKEINVAGKTVSSHPGVGMGVAFNSFIQDDGEALLKAYVEHLASRPKSGESAAGIMH